MSSNRKLKDLKLNITTFYKGLLLLFLMSFYFPSISFAQENKTGTLIINVKGIKNQKGKIRVSLYNKADGFPSSPDKAKFFAEGNILNNSSKIEVKNLPFGEYAVSLIHDENNNLKVETNFLGIPKEGIGTSNDARNTFGPPNFDQAKFKFTEDNQTIIINMFYF